MTFRLPPSLHTESNESALRQLQRYYARPFDSAEAFTGSAFDTWDSTGTRSLDADRFTADDLVAVSFLSVHVSARAAQSLLDERANEFNALLVQVGHDREFVDIEPGDIAPTWSVWRLDGELRGLDDVGRTIASKLLARKRPRLVPVYDKVIGEVLGVEVEHWSALHAALCADHRALHGRLLNLRGQAGLAEDVSALRVLDVIAWMDGAHPL